MLAPNELADLYRQHRNTHVLSVYLDTDQHDFAEREKWQIALKTAVAEQRDKAGDTEAFDRALEQLKARLADNDGGFLNGRGWVGFATSHDLLYSEGLPVPMPNLVRWEDGLRVAPYARALKQARPVVAVVIDSRKARILRYLMGLLSQSDFLEADTYLGDLTDVGAAKRPSIHSGRRGKTGTDAAQHFLDVERGRLVGRVAEEVREEVGTDGLLIIGGDDRTVDALVKDLGDFASERRRIRPSLNFDMSDAEIQASVEEAASEISESLQRALVDDLIGSARSDGDACLGETETERAAVEGRIDTLVVSDGFRRRDPDRADHFEGTALEHGASVVEVSRGVGERLDEEAGGIGAVLRYRVRG